jgi:thioredoxin 1
MFRNILLLLFAVSVLSCKKEDISGDTGVLKTITSLSEYETEIKTGVTLMYFHANWCSVCRDQRPSVEGLIGQTDLKAAKFGQVDTDTNKAITDKYDVSGQPVIIIYKDNQEKHRLFGKGHSQQKLSDLIKALL